LKEYNENTSDYSARSASQQTNLYLQVQRGIKKIRDNIWKICVLHRSTPYKCYSFRSLFCSKQFGRKAEICIQIRKFFSEDTAFSVYFYHQAVPQLLTNMAVSLPRCYNGY